LDSLGECAEVGDALELVIGQFDAEVVLKTSEEIEGLQAVDAESLEEVIIGREFFARDFEMGRGESENFVESVIECRCGHELV
jgi:hypothetical protein